MSDTKTPRYRLLNLFGFLLCVFAIAFAVLYLQGELGLDPCPLCMAARLVVLTVAGIFLLAFLHNPRQLGQRIYSLLGILATLAGLGVSLRHVWLQSLPADEVPECGPGLEYMLEAFPLKDALGMILTGSGECAEVQWQFLGLTLPQQTVIFFAVILLIQVIQFRKKQPRGYFT